MKKSRQIESLKISRFFWEVPCVQVQRCQKRIKV